MVPSLVTGDPATVKMSGAAIATDVTVPVFPAAETDDGLVLIHQLSGDKRVVHNGVDPRQQIRGSFAESICKDWVGPRIPLRVGIHDRQRRESLHVGGLRQEIYCTRPTTACPDTVCNDPSKRP